MTNEHVSDESQQFPARKSVHATSCSQPPSPLGTLIAFPPEIRSLIYPYALASSPALIRISKAMHAETQSLLYKYSIYRMNINIDRTQPWPVHWYSYTEEAVGPPDNRPQVTTSPSNLLTTFPGTLANIQHYRI